MLFSIILWLGLAVAGETASPVPTSEPSVLACAAATHGVEGESDWTPTDPEAELELELFRDQHWQGDFVRSNPSDEQVAGYWAAIGALAQAPENRKALRTSCRAQPASRTVARLPKTHASLECIHYADPEWQRVKASILEAQANPTHIAGMCSAISALNARRLEAMDKLERGELACTAPESMWTTHAEMILQWKMLAIAKCPGART